MVGWTPSSLKGLLSSFQEEIGLLRLAMWNEFTQFDCI